MSLITISELRVLLKRQDTTENSTRGRCIYYRTFTHIVPKHACINWTRKNLHTCEVNQWLTYELYSSYLYDTLYRYSAEMSYR